MKLSTRKITQNAVIAALYFVLTLVSSPLSFGLIQFRISEFLMLLCFFRKDYVIGLTMGCFLANLSLSATFLGAGGWIDLLIGTAATLIAGLIMPYTKRLFIASLIPVLTNGILVGLELSLILEIDQFWVCFGFVCLGELVCVSVIGYTLMMILKHKVKPAFNLIGADRNLEVKW